MVNAHAKLSYVLHQQIFCIRTTFSMDNTLTAMAMDRVIYAMYPHQVAVP
jgi:hypothetical protein